MVDNQNMEISEEVIAEATGLDLEGINFYRERKLSDIAIEEFVDSKLEKSCQVKIGKSYMNLASVSHPWHFILFEIMEYLTLVGDLRNVMDIILYWPTTLGIVSRLIFLTI